MKSSQRTFLIAAGAIVIAFALIVFFLIPALRAAPPYPAFQAPELGYGSQTAEGRIIEVIEAGQIQLGDLTQDYQTLKVEILEGEFEGLMLDLDYGVTQLRPAGLDLKPGDRIFLTIGRGVDNTLQTQFQDFRRTGPLLILFVTFMIFSVLISGWKGVRGLLGMASQHRRDHSIHHPPDPGR